MTGVTATSQKKLMLLGGRAYPQLAPRSPTAWASSRPGPADDFANGEIMVRFLESVRGCDAFVLQSHTAPINDWIMEHLIMVDALKRASAKRITVVMPFFGYARQDKKSAAVSRSRRGSSLTCSPRRAPTGYGGRPAHGADPGLLRRAGGPPVRAADPR